MIDIITLLLVILKGLFIGVICSAPCGPVGVLCIQRVLNKGFKYGILTGIGATLSDIIYALISGLGMSFVTDFVKDENNKLIMQLLGSAMLLAFGIYMILTHHNRHTIKVSKERGLLKNFFTAFLLTFSNPLIILLFLVLFARFDFITPDLPVNMAIGYLSIIFGAMLWWLGLSFVINKIRNTFSDKYIRTLNMGIGIIVISAAIAGFVFTITGLHWY
ncbi:MAG: LysE family transporter [Bacteroidaceae bacterium]|nr:LysE family transporter [Prevotellaceae bacterium]MDY2849494.1 LysE family transporter [Bacteroidaceae bacterium]